MKTGRLRAIDKDVFLTFRSSPDAMAMRKTANQCYVIGTVWMAQTLGELLNLNKRAVSMFVLSYLESMISMDRLTLLRR